MTPPVILTRGGRQQDGTPIVYFDLDEEIYDKLVEMAKDDQMHVNRWFSDEIEFRYSLFEQSANNDEG